MGNKKEARKSDLWNYDKASNIEGDKMGQQYFGYDPGIHDYDHDSQLHDWICSTGYGVMCTEEPPPECIDFIRSQYDRFGIPYSKEIEEVAVIGARATFYVIDSMDPYCVLFDSSDVDFTMEWRDQAYTVSLSWEQSKTEKYKGESYYTSREANPGEIETYRYLPNRDVERFNDMMQKPGLGALPNGVGHMIDDLLTGEFNCADALSVLELQSEIELRKLCATENGVDHVRMLAYFQLAAWASYLWFCGPYGRDFRRENHEVFKVATTYGECVLIDGCVLSPEFYKKENRPPVSCFRCSIAAWCVEPTLIMDNAYNVCEHCTHDGMKVHPMATCGSKICILSECPHHPYHHMGGAGIQHAAKQRGMLQQTASGPRPLSLGQATSSERKLLK